MNSDSNDCVQPETEICKKCPIVLIRRLEHSEYTSELLVPEREHGLEKEELNRKSLMKKETANATIALKEDLKCQSKLDIVDRKSVIINMSNRQNLIPDSNLCKNTEPSYNNDKHNADVFHPISTHLQSVSNINIGENTTTDSLNNKEKTIMNVDSVPDGACEDILLKTNLSLKENEEKHSYNTQTTEDPKCLPTNKQSKQSYSHKIFNMSNSLSKKPTAHVEPFVKELNLRSGQRKSRGFYEELNTIIIDTHLPIRSSSTFQNIKQKETEKLHTMNNSSLAKEYSQVSDSFENLFISIGTDRNEPKSNGNYKKIHSDIISKIWRPMDISEKKNCQNINSDLYSMHHNKNLFGENFNIKDRPFFINSLYETKSCNEKLDYTDKPKMINSHKICIRRTMSCNDLHRLNKYAYQQLKISSSLPDLSSIEKIQKRECITKSEENSSGASTADDESDKSSSDEDEKSLHVDIVNNIDTMSTDLPNEQREDNVEINKFKRFSSSKKKRRKLKKKKMRQHTESPNENNKPEHNKRRSTKRKEKEYEIIATQLRIQVLNEKERDRRLAQELPGFNWLEEKIRNKDSSTTDTTNTCAKNDPRRKSIISELEESSSIPNKQIASVIPDTTSNQNISSILGSSFTKNTIDALRESKNSMTLNTVSSSTPRHSPCTEDVDKQTDEYIAESSNNSKQTEKESQGNDVSYLNRHIQTAVPPLIPTYKVTALPKQRRASLELKPITNQVHKEQDSKSLANSETTAKIKNHSDVDVTYSRNNAAVKHFDDGHFIVEKSNTPHSEKLSILKDAFKSKLNGCSELKMIDREAQSIETNDELLTAQPISEPNTKLPDESLTVNRKLFNPDEIYMSSPNQIEKEALMLSDSANNSVGNSLLGKILTQNTKSTINSPIVIATLLEELMKTRKEVEKLRKVQEQMLRGERYSHTVIESQPNKTEKYDTLMPQSNIELEEINKRPLEGEIDAKFNRKRESPIQNFVNKKQKTVSANTDDGKTITIRYTLQQPSVQSNSEAVESKDVRNVVGLNSKSSKVNSLEKLSPFLRQDGNFNSKKLIHSTTNLINYSQETPKTEPYKNELMKLLEPSGKYQRVHLPELPNLIPSSNYSPSAFHKNVPYYGDKINSNMVRYPYTYPSTSLPQKQSNQLMEPYNYQHRYLYENKTNNLPEEEIQATSNKTQYSKLSEKPYNAINSQHHDLTRNERYSNYPSLFNEKSSYEPTKVNTKVPTSLSPQTFQPKILIPPETNISHYKDWHSSVHHSSVSENRTYQRIAPQLSMYDKPISSVRESSPYYKPNISGKAPEVYPQSKSYSPNVTQCDSSIKQNVETSRSPNDKPNRIPNPNTYNPPLAVASSSSNAYYSTQMRSLQPTHSQYAPSIVQGISGQKQIYYDQRPVIQSPLEQKIASYPQRGYSPPVPRRDIQLPQKYVLARQPYENIQNPEDPKNSLHQSNILVQDVSQHRIMNSNQNKPFPETVNTSPLRCSPSASTDNLAVKTISKKCLVCERMAQFLCSGCKLAWYCSKECQRDHWSEHSPTCVSKS